ncbi:MAG TPA: ABC transporter permease [Chitinophagaceae bacterium]|nr:ABC transporter permease [Chitinophagaceae bacterium]
MLKNYITIAWRNLVKNKAYSLINITGLAAGMAIAMLIGLWIWNETSFDRYFKNYDRIAQVMQNETYNGKISTGKGVDMPLAAELRRTYGENFKYVVASSWSMNSLVSAGEKKLSTQGNYMETGAPAMLGLKMVAGSYGAFGTHATVLLSQSTAKALFGNEDPIGKVVKIDVDYNEKVVGVYQDLPKNTSFSDVAFIAPFLDLTTWVTGNENNWYNGSFQVFVQLADNADMAAVSAKIKNIKLNKIDPATAKQQQPAMLLQPMSKWHLYADFKDGVNAGGAIQYVWMFAIIGIFVLLLACINFMNLSTARSEKRSREVGIRKAIGSLRSQLIGQFFGESILVAFLAFVLSIVLVIVLLPFFNSISGKQIGMPWGNIYFWLLSVGFSFVTGLVAGIYPALYLSSFKPVKVLKGTFKAGRNATLPRKILVVVQFTVSVILIISTITIFRQVQFAKSRPIGYSRQGLITIIMATLNYHNNIANMRNDLLQQGAIVDLEESNTPVTENDHYDGGFSWQGKDPQLAAKFNIVGSGIEYGKTIGWQFVDGRDFSKQFATDSSAIIVNEAAANFMGFKKPVGQTIQWNKRNFKIIGVVKNMVTESPYDPVKQTIYYLDGDIGGIVNIRLSPNMPTAESLAKVAAVCKKYSPDEPFNYTFADEEYGHKFQDEERVGQLAFFFAALAIFISCLGLFGMASFVAEQRTREIGVRKVFGASVFSLWGLLNKDFATLVLLAMLIATPVAYYFMTNWLQNYQLHTQLSWWIFAATGAGALLITIVTVSYQSIKAALMNPVKAIRTE